jgi:hypothetical protein
LKNLKVAFVLRWGGKVVRGAYMQYEQARAASLDLTSPLHPTYQFTNMAYDRSVPTGSNRNLQRYISVLHMNYTSL